MPEMRENDLKSHTRYLSALFFPEHCALCGRPVLVTTEICDKCRKTSAVVKAPRCAQCGRSTDACRCHGKNNFYEALTSPFYYRNEVKAGILRWKFRSAFCHTPFFAKAVAVSIQRDFRDVKFDCITFVPQTAMEQSDKEYNQSELLAEAVGAVLHIPVQPLLIKITDNVRQRELPLCRKSGNVFGVFDYRCPFKAEGQTVLLIDDIRTSGCTLNECAKMLHLGGAAAVFCAVIAVSG